MAHLYDISQHKSGRVTQQVTQKVTLPSYITVTQVANTLRVTPTTVHKWINSGQLPALKLGDHSRVIRIPLDEYEKFLERGTISASGDAL